jgi:hypothetical protein
MDRLKKFSNFYSNPINEEESSNLENLEEAISLINMTRLADFLEEKGLVLEDIEPFDNDGEAILVSLGSKSYGGEIPRKISYYLDEFKEILGQEIGVRTSWSFSPNYNCRDIIFYLDNPIDPKILSVKRALRFSS